MLEVINLLQTTYLDPGTVSVRVAFVLRSTEVLPAFSDLFPLFQHQPPIFWTLRWVGGGWLRIFLIYPRTCSIGSRDGGWVDGLESFKPTPVVVHLGVGMGDGLMAWNLSNLPP